MTLTTALLIMVPTNIGTLVLGFLWGRKIRAIIQIGETMSENADTPERRGSAPRWMYFLAAAVALIGIGMSVLGVLVVNNAGRQDKLVGCVAGYSNAAADVARTRAGATNAVFAEIDAVFEQVRAAFDAAPDAGRDKVLAAIDGYNSARAKAKQAQRDNPLPEAPQNACAELLN